MWVWSSGSEKESTAVREKLDEKIRSYAAGELQHAVDVVSSIWKVSNEPKPAVPRPAPPPVPSNPTSVRFSLSWLSSIGTKSKESDMRRPFIKSIQEGYLLDRKYWAKRSREGAIKPIYFSTMIQTFQNESPDLDRRE